MRTLVVCSGGLDSVTLSHKIAIDQTLIHLVSFDYGQRHKKELEYARRCAERLRITHDVVDITDVGRRLTGSALTDDAAVPEGHYAEETMRLTVVPNRNAIMLTIAFGVALAQRAEAVAAAVHGGDHFIYPDCRPSFVDAFATMQRNALDGFAQIAFETPFVHWSKANIVREGARLGVPFAETWSCYKGGVRHCGRCGTCVERREAFEMYTIAKRFAFSASHIIGGLPADHPCAQLHGHNYEVEVVLQSATLDAVGFVRDYGELSAVKDFIDGTVDHKHLNDVFGHDRTTAEVISKWVYDWCKARWPEVVAVRVSETPRTWAEYRP